MSQKLVKELKDNISQSLKEHQPIITITLRTILSEAQTIALKNKRKELQDSDIITAAIKCVKEGSEGIKIYKNLEGKIAEDNYLKNTRLKTLAEHYLPKQLTEIEIMYKVDKILSNINTSSMRDMGKVMKQFKIENSNGTYDTKLVSKYVKSKLS